jgi:plastocyanin
MTHNLRFGLFMTGLIGIGVWIMATPAESAVNQITVGSYFYEDATEGDGKIEAKVGDQLQFVFVDNGRGSPHTVEIDELGIHSGNVGTGGTFTTPPLTKPGTYRVYCKPHENKGHFTTLIVHGNTEPPPSTTTAESPLSPTTTSTSTTTTMAPATTTPVSQSTTTTPAETATTLAASPPPTTGAPEPESEPTSITTDPSSEQPATDTDGNGESAPATTQAPVGLGHIDFEAAGISAPPSPLEEALGRSTGDNAPWTRSVWVGLLSLIPIAAIAAVATRRHQNRTPQTDT